MPVNRFDQARGQQYVSTYVPLPFQELAALGENIQKKAQAAEDNMSALEKAIADVKVVDEVYSQGDSENPQYGYRSTGYRQHQNELLNKAKTAHQDLVNKYQAGEIDLRELEKQSRQFNNQFKDDYAKLKLAEANSANIMKINEELNKSSDASTHTFLTNKLAREGSRLLQNPFATEYKGAPIGKFVKEEEVVNTFADKFKDKILSDTVSYRDQYGKLHYKSKTGVGEKDILQSLSMLDNSEIAQQWQEKAYYDLVSRGIDPNTKKVVKYVEKDSKGNPIEKSYETTEFQHLYNTQKQNFASAVIAKARHENPDEKIIDDDLYNWGQKRKIEREEAFGLGQTVPGQIVTDIVPEDIKSLEDHKGDIDWGKLIGGLQSTDKKDINTAIIALEHSKGPNKEKLTKLSNFMVDAAKAIGYDKKVQHENFNEIYNLYKQQVSKIAPDYQMTPFETEVISNNIRTQRNNYEFVDETGKVLTDNIVLDDTFNADQKIIRDKDGKPSVLYKGTYVKPGESKPTVVTIRPLGIQTNIANDRVAQQQKRALQYLTTGKVDNSEDLKNIQTSGLTGTKEKVIDFQPDIITPGVGYVTINEDVNNRSKQKIIKVAYNYDGGKLNILAQDPTKITPSQFMNEQFKNYYSTPQGVAELQSGMSKETKLPTLSNAYNGKR